MGARTVAVVLLWSALASGEPPHKSDRLAEGLMAEGDRFMQQKDMTAAIALFEAARVLTGDRPGPHLMLGLAYASSDKCDKALVHLEKYLSLKKSDPRHEATTSLAACQITEKARHQQKIEEDRSAVDTKQRLDRALQMMAGEQERNRQLEQRLRSAESSPRTPPTQLYNHANVVRNLGQRVFIEWALTIYVTPDGKGAVREFSFMQDANGYVVEPGGVFDAGPGIAVIMRVEQPGGIRSVTWYSSALSPTLNQRW